MPGRVTICECAARDGLQHERAFIATETKAALIDRFTAIGFVRIEATSFSHPKFVPQFADAEAVLERINRKPGVYYKSTCVNAKAVERAMAARTAGHGPTEISVIGTASDAHTFKNVKKTRAQVKVELEEIIGPARSAGFRIVGTVGSAFGCPYTGEVTEDQVDDWLRFFVSHGIDMICLGDTTGTANPLQVERRFGRFLDRYPHVAFVAHFHDTRGCGLANAVAAMRAGVTYLDSAFGGLGGHPPDIKYNQGHTGNIATEDLVAMLAEMGVETGLDPAQVMETAHFVEAAIGRELQGRVARAGLASNRLHDPEVEAFLAGRQP